MNREQVERLADTELNRCLCMAVGGSPGNYAGDIRHAWWLLPKTPYFVDATAPNLGIDFEFHFQDGVTFKATGSTVEQARSRAALLALTAMTAPAAPEGREGGK